MFSSQFVYKFPLYIYTIRAVYMQSLYHNASCKTYTTPLHAFSIPLYYVLRMTKKTILKSTSKRTVCTFKATSDEMKKIKAKANTYAEGNISAWIRYAASELEPNPLDLH